MPRGRGHRAALEEIGTELNLVPYLDMMTTLVLFLLVNITSFLSFTMLTAAIPQMSPNSEEVKAQSKEQLLLIVRVTRNGYMVDPNVQGGPAIKQSALSKTSDGKFNFEELNTTAINIKQKFPTESRVLLIAEPAVIYDDIIHTMDALREKKSGDADLFPDVTLSIF